MPNEHLPRVLEPDLLRERAASAAAPLTRVLACVRP
jgi:hypothetical protein